MGVLADCESTVQEAIDGLGGLDVIISNAVWLLETLFCSGASIYPFFLSQRARAGLNSQNSAILTL